jgi:hypothetical protein
VAASEEAVELREAGVRGTSNLSYTDPALARF